MLVDVRRILDTIPGTSADLSHRAVSAFVGFVERKLGGILIRDPNLLYLAEANLRAPSEIAALLLEAGVLASPLKRVARPCDEPPIRIWRAVTNTSSKHVTGGLAYTDDAQAAYATAAEGLERYLWAEATDHFIKPIRCSENRIKKNGQYLSLARFEGFSPEQRQNDKRTVISEDTDLLWIQGVSLVTGKKTYLPAQVVSSKAESTYRPDGTREPVVRLCITTGLATWTDTPGARLRGAYEAIERDAYMIWWLNQLIVPRMPIEMLCESDPSLKSLIDTCTRYGLKVHALRLVTDAPAHAVCVVVEDESAVGPRYTFGLKAGRSLPTIVEAGVLEALRARHTYRLYRAEGKSWDTTTPTEKIGHRDRLYYWSVPEHAKKLTKLLSGKEIPPAKEAWEESTDEEHLDCIVSWCREAGYEYVSVNLGASKSNPTPWSVEMAVIPELQPTYLNENLRQASGARLRDIPTRFGYTPRETPFLSAPHPFL